jgi:hypothetical protein
VKNVTWALAGLILVPTASTSIQLLEQKLR